MTGDTDSELDWVAQTCTLPTIERPMRVAEFDALFATAVRQVERMTPTWLRLRLDGVDDLEARARDLTERESRCCSFFTFTVRPERPRSVIVDIEVPPARVDVLDALAALAQGVR
jgi:hypothetical protein